MNGERPGHEDAPILVGDVVVRHRDGHRNGSAEERDPGRMAAAGVGVDAVAGDPVIHDDVARNVLARRMSVDAHPGLAVIAQRVVDDPVVVGSRPGERGEHPNARAAIAFGDVVDDEVVAVSYTHLLAHDTDSYLV